MSRPVGNKFADFFPNAPSVIQQRKSSKTLDTGKHRAEPSGRSEDHAPAKYSSSRRLSSHSSSSPTRGQFSTSSRKPDAASRRPDEVENSTGDLLNGVGSASSTSTASSIFSSNATMTAVPLTNGAHFNTLTPLTTSDGSPRGKAMTPPTDSTNLNAAARNSVHAVSSSSAMTPQHTPTSSRPSARETGLSVKGSKCTYDPELDKSIPSRDKRKLRAAFADFGNRPEDNMTPADPRPSIPGYLKGVSGKGKAKLRAAPYSLKLWRSEASSVPPSAGINAAPVTVVVSWL